MASKFNTLQSVSERKQALKERIISRLPDYHRIQLIHLILNDQLAPTDINNVIHGYLNSGYMVVPTDHMHDLEMLIFWDHIVLQRWWRRCIKYRRFKRFIRQPRYSAYLNAEGQFGRRFDTAQTLKWGKCALE